MGQKTVCVIGAGVGGLAVALRLRARGYRVVVLEQQATAGGKMAQLQLGDYRFDRGPSLLTLPHLLDELFALFGRRRTDYLPIVQLEATARYFFSDGLVLQAWSDPDRFRQEVAAAGLPADRLADYLRQQAFLYTHTADFFLFSSLHRWQSYVGEGGRKSLRALPRLDAWRTMHRRNRSTFGDSALTQLFDRYATYNGSNPYQAPATLNMIAHLEHHTGAWFPKNGMHAVVQALQTLAEEQGVEFQFSTRVTGLRTQRSKVVGVETPAGVVEADWVVSNVDVTAFYRDLLPDKRRYRRLSRRERSSSALIFYWGLRLQSSLEVHNLLFSADYKAEFDHLFKYKTLAEDLSVYIFISKKVVPGAAPEGCENWFVMVNAPEDVGQDWKRLTARVREIVLAKIKAVLAIDVEQVLEEEAVLTPVDIARETGSVNGSLYGHSSNSPLAAFLRPPNFSSRYKNLYFSGGSVHPGGGIPLCLASARIVDELLMEKEKDNIKGTPL